VFSVPSVSLWEAYPVVVDEDGGEWVSWDDDEEEIRVEDSPQFSGYAGDELAALACFHLAGKLVCIVADADAHTKDEVMTQNRAEPLPKPNLSQGARSPRPSAPLFQLT